MTDMAYCYFRTAYQAERFRARLPKSFVISEPWTTDTPYQSRPVVVTVRERDDSVMGERTFATLLTICNLYDGLVSDEPSLPRPAMPGSASPSQVLPHHAEDEGTRRPGGAPFSGPLPGDIVDETNPK